MLYSTLLILTLCRKRAKMNKYLWLVSPWFFQQFSSGRGQGGGSPGEKDREREAGARNRGKCMTQYCAKLLPVNETLQVSKAIRMAPQFMLISSTGSKVKRCFQHKLSRHCYGFWRLQGFITSSPSTILVLLCKVLLCCTLSLWNKYSSTSNQYFPVVLFIVLCKLVLTFESVDAILKCDHWNESYL